MIKFIFKTIFCVALVILFLSPAAWLKRNDWVPRAAEKWTAENQAIFFQDSLKIYGFNLKKDLTVSIETIHGVWQTEKGGFPFEVHQVEITDPVTHFLFRKPVNIRFGQFRPRGSAHPGLEGETLFMNDAEETFELTTRFRGLYLEEIRDLNPQGLKGSSGLLTGDLSLITKKSGEQQFKLHLSAPPPGGRIQAEVFSLLLPYLPPADKKTLASIQALKTVGYKEADMTAELAEEDALKVLLKINVPEYNLNLNLNLTLRVEENEAFFHLIQLMGLVKLESP